MSSSEPAITATGLGKFYRIIPSEGRPSTLGEAVEQRVRRPFHRRPRKKLWALRDASFEVRAGEVIGIIGANGAGKTTLLKLLSRITDPSEGEARLIGRVGTLLEVGTGFHVELTGRENVFLNASILGMNRREVLSRFDEIVDFAGVGEFLDTPVKRYSSGMQVRLAFAVAAHLEPEILVIDEVLAVGDVEFQRRCLGKMGEVASQEGRTVLFVSHNMAAVEALCTRGMYIEGGRIAFDGEVGGAIQRYLASGSKLGIDTQPGVFDLVARRPDVEAPLLRKLTLRDSRGVATDTIRMGEALSLVIDVEGLSEIPVAHLAVRVRSELEQQVFSLSTYMAPLRVIGPRAAREHVILSIPRLPLVPGHYWMSVEIKLSKTIFDKVERAASFDVVAADVYGTGYELTSQHGVFYVDADWELHAGESAAADSRSPAHV